MDEVIPGLWIGDLASAYSAEQLKANNIHSVLTAMRGRIQLSDSLSQYQIILDDDVYTNVTSHLLPAIKFIDEELKKGHGVLVHCLAGTSRSVIVVAAYLIWKAEGSLDTQAALSFVKQRRPHADPNEAFVRQLDSFHKSGFQIRVQA